MHIFNPWVQLNGWLQILNPYPPALAKVAQECSISATNFIVPQAVSRPRQRMKMHHSTEPTD